MIKCDNKLWPPVNWRGKTMDSRWYFQLHGGLSMQYVDFVGAEFIHDTWMIWLWINTYTVFAGVIAYVSIHWNVSAIFMFPSGTEMADQSPHGRRGGLHSRPCLWLGHHAAPRGWEKKIWIWSPTRKILGKKTAFQLMVKEIVACNFFLCMRVVKRTEGSKRQTVGFQLSFQRLNPTHHGIAVWLNSSEAEQKETLVGPCCHVATWRIVLCYLDRWKSPKKIWMRWDI